MDWLFLVMLWVVLLQLVVFLDMLLHLLWMCKSSHDDLLHQSDAVFMHGGIFGPRPGVGYGDP